MKERWGTMTSKERVRIALSHEEPDRVPMYADFTPEVEKRLRSFFREKENKKKLEHSPKLRHSPHSTDFGLLLGNDIVVITQGVVNSFYGEDADKYICEWGITWKRVPYRGGFYTEITEHPLADEKKINSYRAPDPNLDWRYEEARSLIQQYREDYWIVGYIPATIFECSWYLRGMDLLLEDMIINKSVAGVIMDKTMQYSLVAGKKLIELGVDMIWTGDDVGMQTGMMFSPSLWREFLKPRYAFLYQEFRKANSDIKIAYHSDGDCTAIIPEMIEMGLDVLNPIQPKCIDPAKMKCLYGDRLSFFGTVDTQETFPFGSTGDVKKEVRERIQTVGESGGLILAPTHNIQVDVKTENILAFYEAVREYGAYPLKGLE